MAVREYIGARYVPKFDGDWDNSKTYEPLTIVSVANVGSYTSKKYVPVGVPITDTDYWVLTANVSGQMIHLQEEIDAIKETIITPENFGAKGDGVTDDTAAIQSALDEGGYILFKDGATYMVDAETNLKVKSNSVVDLNGATIKAIANSNDYYNIFLIEEQEKVVIRDGYIIGDRDSHGSATGEWGYGVYVHGSNDILLDNLTITKCWGDGIAITTHEDLAACYNVRVNNCTIKNCRRQGLSVMWCEDVILTNNLIEQISGTAPGAAIDVEPNPGQTAHNIIIANNIFKYTARGLIISGVASGAVCDKVVVNDNIFIHNNVTDTQLVVSKANDCIIKGNLFKITTSSSGLWQISNAGNIRISDNEISGGNITGSFAVIAGTTGILSNNKFTDITVSAHLLYLLNNVNFIIRNNNFIKCVCGSTHAVINMYGSSAEPTRRNIIDYNIIRECTALSAVILAAYADYNTLSYNQIDGTYTYGITTSTATSAHNAALFNIVSGGSSGNITGLGGVWNDSKIANIEGGTFTP